jgi:hypothetical protein
LICKPEGGGVKLEWELLEVMVMVMMMMVMITMMRNNDNTDDDNDVEHDDEDGDDAMRRGGCGRFTCEAVCLWQVT